MPSSAAAANHPAVAGHGGRGASAVNAAAAAAAMSSDISRRNPQEDYELLQVRNPQIFRFKPFCLLSFDRKKLYVVFVFCTGMQCVSRDLCRNLLGAFSRPFFVTHG